MVPCAPASAPSAPNRQLVTACEVSTLPATTAAGYSGDSIDFFGMMTLIGRRQPASKCSLIRNTCQGYFEPGFKLSKSLCSGAGILLECAVNAPNLVEFLRT